MSLLDRGNTSVLLYPEESWVDPDGNPMRRPSPNPVPARVRLQPAAQSGTSARRAEQDNEGFETEGVYTMRIPDTSYAGVLGPQSRVGWNGEYWALLGDPFLYEGSRRTRHRIYTIRKS
jgi:hypothetical protein